MADRPILFSAPMIRALLAGTKTQTRRLLTPRNTLFDGGRWPNYLGEEAFHWGRAWIDPGPSPAGNPGPYLKLPVTNIAMQAGSREETVHRVYPVVQPGDRLWVRETFSVTSDGCFPSYIRFRADPEGTPGVPCHPDKRYGSRTEWRPSIHMPRWASRLTLTVTEVRVQRLQEISEADAVAEGYFSAAVTPICDGPDCETDLARSCSRGACDVSKRWYADLWTSLHGPGSWEANPWVVALSFDVRKGNIDG